MQKINKYVATDGAEFNSPGEAIKHDAELRGLHFICPKCQGKTTMNGKPITKQERDYEMEGGDGFFAQPRYKTVTTGYEQVPCDVCRGAGYTAQEMKPVTRTEVIGYR